MRPQGIVIVVLACFLGCETYMDFNPVNGDTGDAGVCTPGSTITCYAGPDGTEGVGICRAGTRTCGVDGTNYEQCVGSIIPQSEDCATSDDENCDGSPICSGSLLWSKRFGSDGDDIVTSVAVDDAGAVFITGTFTGSVDFGGGELKSAGGGDVFLVKFDADGNHLWSKRFGDPATPQIASAVTVDNVGNVLIAGHFAGTITFDNGANWPGQGGSDIFVVKFNTAGVYSWGKYFSNLSTNAVAAIATDGANSPVLVGYSGGVLDFGGGKLYGSGGADVFIVKLDSDGNHRWSKRFGGADDQRGQEVALTSGGDVIIAADFLGSIGIGPSTLVSQGGTDIALGGLNPLGQHIWSSSYGDMSEQNAGDVEFDGLGSTIAVGSFAGTLNFGATPLVSVGDADIFIVKIDANGDHLWSKRFGDTAPQGADRADVDGSGNIAVTGHFAGEVDFGGRTLVSAGGNDIFLVKLDANGNHIWSKSFGDGESQDNADVAVDNGGNVLLVTSAPGTMDFGGGPLVGVGGRDIFVAKFSP